MSHYEYLIVLTFCLAFPLLFNIFHSNAPLKPFLKEVFLSSFIVSIPWIIWDIWATENRHWGFNENYYLGFKFFNLPLEEVAFFFVIPFCCTFIWAIVKDYTNFENFKNTLLNKK